MSKAALKRKLGYAGDLSLVDTDRIVQKAEGGTYEKGNVRLLEPRAHMKRHGTLRERTVVLTEVKNVIDDRSQVQKLELKINNQLLAYTRRTDDQHPVTVAFLTEMLEGVKTRLEAIDNDLARLMKEYAAVDPVTAAVLSVPFVGPVTAAYLAAYVDLTIADTASSLWAYVGFDKPAHLRYELAPGADPKKGRGGNKTLRTRLYVTASVMWKSGSEARRKNGSVSAYRLVGDAVKARLAVSERVVKSRNTKGQLVDVMWKDAKPSHRQGAAVRAMIKHFLADYWKVGREIMGLSARQLYVEEKLGHTSIVQPRERGWQW